MDDEAAAKKQLGSMMYGLRSLGDKLEKAAKALQASLDKHAPTLAKAQAAPDQLALSKLSSPELYAILALLGAMCKTQVLFMEMGQRQLATSIDQMSELIDLDL